MVWENAPSALSKLALIKFGELLDLANSAIGNKATSFSDRAVMSSTERLIRIQKQLLDIDPDDPTLWQTLGMFHLGPGIEEDRCEAALANLDRALDLDPENAFALLMRGDAYRMLDRYEEAVADFDRALELNPDNADALAFRGESYRMLDRYEEAVADLTRALELGPDDADALASRGESYRLLDRYEEAVADLTRALELDPASAFALGSRGASYLLLDRYDEAVADLTRALELARRAPSPCGAAAIATACSTATTRRSPT